MPQLPWAAIGAVWLYALVWMVVIDLVKLLYVRIQDGREAREAVLHQPIAGGKRRELHQEADGRAGRQGPAQKFDPAFRGKHGDDQAAAKELETVKAKLGDLQRKMYGDNRTRC